MASDPHAASAARNTAFSRRCRWFRVVTALGIVANIAAATYGIVMPASMITLLKLEPATPLVWLRFAAFLLILLSLFYIPAAIDPFRNRFSAIVSILCRAGGVAFFAIIGGRYIVFGLFDLAFGLPQAILLGLAWRQRQAGETVP